MSWNENWMPECPMITSGQGKDGKHRTYIIAANRVDFEAMCMAAGLSSVGIREGTWYLGYERIVKEHEYA